MRTHAKASPKSRGLFGIACLCVLGLAAFLGTGAPTAGAAESFPGQGFLPEDRAWEMVSPPNKEGGGVSVDSQRTRAAADGSALGFVSLRGFGDVASTSVGTDYMSVRSFDPDPGSNGWLTHAIAPPQAASPLVSLLRQLEPLYVGEFSSDLDSGVFFSNAPLTADPMVEKVFNVYRRSDLRTPGGGAYEVLTQCPLCLETSTPLPPYSGANPGAQANNRRPWLVGASPDFEHIAFESQLQLTEDAPPPSTGSPRLYEWQNGIVRYAGRIPVAPAIECDDVNGPPCSPAEASVGGQGAGSSHGAILTPHVVSDGSDGHSRVILTRPTFDGVNVQDDAFDGNLYMRIDGTSTVQLNASERAVPDTFAPALYLDASVDGSHVFFRSTEALTDDAPLGVKKIYMYDATKPAAAPDNLTLLSVDDEPADGTAGDAQSFIGASADGRYAYLIVAGQLVGGAPPLGNAHGIYLWHDGQLTYLGQAPTGTAQTEIGTEANYQGRSRQARVTPDGRRLLFSTNNGAGLLSVRGGPDYDHGACLSGLGIGCRELYLYSADADTLECVSCNPSGAPATAMATNAVRAFNAGTQTSWHQANALSEDGRYAFFSTAEKLVAADTNGVEDAYVYDAAIGEPQLLSSGKHDSRSWFLDASADASDAFIATSEALSGWDVDTSYDIYDARVGGGFPEPPPAPPSCIGDACQPAPTALDDPGPGSATNQGPGDQRASRNRQGRCPKGRHRVRTRSGKSRCVKKSKRTNSKRRAGR